MATYGISGNGQVPFTGYTNTLGAASAAQGNTSGYVANNGLFQGDEYIARILRNGAGSAALQAILYALTGAAPGGTATKTKKRVQWVQGSPGGLIPIETQTLINRATTTADRTAFQALFTRMPFPATYPADLSGNGGGGKGRW